MEKKQIVYELRLGYNGPLSIEDFYKEVEDWMGEKGLQKDLKRKAEEIGKDGKKIEWIIEAWKEVTHLVKHVVRLRALFDNVKEARIKRKGRNVKLNQAEALIVIDGFLETKLSKQWTTNPLFSFLRTLYDKYVWSIGQTTTERYEGGVNQDCYELHKRLKAFLELYKRKVFKIDKTSF